MKVLLTGANGFLGRHVARLLIGRGDRVLGLDLAFSDPVEGMECATGSVLDTALLARLMPGCEAVVHAAAITGLWSRHRADFERVNLGGTRAVLAAAARAGVGRAVHVSSFVTLISGGRRAPPRRVDESVELSADAMLGPYPRSKRLAELAAREAALPTVILQPSAPIGPGDTAPTPPTAMLRDLAEGRLPAMISCTWNLVDVRSVADGVVRALDRGVAGERYLLSGTNMDTDELLACFERVSGVPGPRRRVPHAVALAAARAAEAVSGLTGRPPGAPVTGVRLAGPALEFDNAKARAALGFQPAPVEAAMRDALVWMRDTGRLGRALPGLPPPALPSR